MSTERKLVSEQKPPESNLLALWEIVSVTTSCLITEWVVFPFAEGSKSIAAIPIVLAIGLMVLSHRERGETLVELGFRADNFLPALRLLLLPTIAAVVLILILAWSFSASGLLLRPFRSRFLLVPFWALFQQYGLQGFINRRAQIALGKGWRGVFLVALTFSLVHLPNPLLAALTLMGGGIWASIYQRQPNHFALAISHSTVSVILALSVPTNLTNSLRVGFKYFGVII